MAGDLGNVEVDASGRCTVHFEVTRFPASSPASSPALTPMITPRPIPHAPRWGRAMLGWASKEK